MTRNQLVMIAAIALTTALWGCKEKDVTFTTDQDQIKKMLTESEAGRDLFRWDSLMIPTNYTVPYDPTAVYRDSVLSHKRNIDVAVNPNRVNFWYPRGLQTEAIAVVSDEFSVRTTRTYPDSVVVDTTDRDLTRYAFVLQLGRESDAYKGWYLWGFNGGGSTSIGVYVTPSTGTGFPGDSSLYQSWPAANAEFTANDGNTFSGRKYIRLEDVRTIADGSRLTVATQALSSGGTKRPFVRISAAGQSGFFTRTMTKIDREHYVDTIQTPTGNPRIWNIVYLETWHDTEHFFTGAHTFAIRVPVATE